ncbi:MAG: integrase [Gammaproteobacteria bacterium]|jgi:site-specific recombinase XerD|nr:integrase [Gammaproteobacteria bacterium]
MSKRIQLRKSVAACLHQNNSGSFSTKATRKDILLGFADDLFDAGIHLTDIRQIKAKHVAKVVSHWKSEELGAGTMKNRMSAVRNLWRSLNKKEVLPTNDELGIAKRVYKPQFNRAIFNPDFSQITNYKIRVALELQRLFGLRREECLKIKPYLADKGTVLELQPTWCKGGRGRFVPIRTEEQRYWLAEAKKFADNKNASLIPAGKNYAQQRYIYEKQVQQIGLSNPHGLRHAYAQKRYKELTGWEAPINGGPRAKELTREQKTKDYQVRMLLSEELGHSRVSILNVYCGK